MSSSFTSTTQISERDWPAYAQTAEQVVHDLQSNAVSGLTADQVTQRRAHYGPNDLGEEKGVQPLQILIAQVVNAMTMVRLASFESR